MGSEYAPISTSNPCLFAPTNRQNIRGFEWIFEEIDCIRNSAGGNEARLCSQGSSGLTRGLMVMGGDRGAGLMMASIILILPSGSGGGSSEGGGSKPSLRSFVSSSTLLISALGIIPIKTSPGINNPPPSRHTCSTHISASRMVSKVANSSATSSRSGSSSSLLPHKTKRRISWTLSGNAPLLVFKHVIGTSFGISISTSSSTNTFFFFFAGSTGTGMLSLPFPFFLSLVCVAIKEVSSLLASSSSARFF
mmetsp:Transcript_28034/g.43461  ORF Transcript_28034/g.43461 Transcript_28034/m.43461 type:complete len:250 (+) Transcript_28034:306-1055(+)